MNWYEDSWVFEKMVHGRVALQERYKIMTNNIQRIDCLCRTVGHWVKVPKTLKEDTLMWVDGVGLVLGF